MLENCARPPRRGVKIFAVRGVRVGREVLHCGAKLRTKVSKWCSGGYVREVRSSFGLESFERALWLA